MVEERTCTCVEHEHQWAADQAVTAVCIQDGCDCVNEPAVVAAAEAVAEAAGQMSVVTVPDRVEVDGFTYMPGHEWEVTPEVAQALVDAGGTVLSGASTEPPAPPVEAPAPVDTPPVEPPPAEPPAPAEPAAPA